LEPLVSIIVIVYNSSEYILETLESIKAQTYKNIELIISDDGSIDDSLKICHEWINANKDRFCRTELITMSANTGISANCNRGLKISKGVWIKLIAGDDMLIEDCIAELIQCTVTSQEDIRILFSNFIKFLGESFNNGEIKKNPYTWFCSKESSAQDQYQMLLRANRVFASTVIIRRDLLELINGYDERFRLLEDWPMWLKITSMGYKIYYLDKALVLYRFHENNLSQTTNHNYIFSQVNKIDISFKKKVLIYRLPFIEGLGLRQQIIGMKICFFLGNDRKNPIARFIYFIFKISNLFSLYRHFLKLFGINYRNAKFL
jgi:glycosyltransferase involved in cell wall biosynthesis